MIRMLIALILTFSFLATLSNQENSDEHSEDDNSPINNIVRKTIPLLLKDVKKTTPVLIQKAVSLIKKKASNLRNKMKTVDDDESESINGVITAVGQGIEGMFTSIANKNPKAFLLSCLDLVSSVASLTGPNGKFISDILGMVSGFIKMFKETPKVESQESMIKRVVETAIEDAQVEDLQFEISGTFELYMILADSISHFRSNGNVSQAQASEFYNHAFRRLVIFGKLKENIKKYCANANDEGKSKKERKNIFTSIERCLSFSSLYCKLSIARHSLLINMAALINSNEDLNELESTAKNLLHLVRSEENTNKETLRFFANPMNHKPYRRVVAEFWQNQYKYPILGAYLQKLNAVFENSLQNHKVMVCSGFMLSGACKEFPPGLFDGDRMKGWRNTIQSTFIPSGMSVSGIIKTRTSDISVGPLFGPYVFGVIPGDEKWIRTYQKLIKDLTPKKWYEYLNPFNKLHRNEYERTLMKMKADWDSLIVKTTRDIDVSNGIMLCTDKNMGVKGLCQFIEPLEKETSISYDLNDLYGINLARAISSMNLPSGIEIIAYDGAKTYGPFYGPGLYPEVCGKDKWTEITLKHVGKEPPSPGKVQICSKPNFQGQCDYLDIGDYEYLEDIHGCGWTRNAGTRNTRINSTKLPYGITVILYTAVNFYGTELGPYHGPAQFPYIDGYDLNDFMILSLKIMKTEDYKREQPVCPFMGDIGFIFDGYQQDKFSKAKQFVRKLIINLKPRANAVSASVFYLGDSDINTEMNDGRDMDKINTNLDKINLAAKRSFGVVEGLNHAQKYMFTLDGNMNKLIPRIFVFLTFESLEEDDPKALNVPKIKLRNDSIHVLTIGHSPNTSKDRLKIIAGSPDKVILFKSINRLTEDAFLEKICKALQKSAV